MKKLFIGTITFRSRDYHVFWNPTDGMVWIAKPNNPEWGLTNANQYAGVPKEQAIDTAFTMLEGEGIF
jgi:hypothetical protein